MVDSAPATASAPSRTDQVEIDNVRIGYPAAITLATHEGSNVWVRYGLMLVIHTIIFSVFGFTSTMSQPARNLIWIGLAFVGVIHCVLWWIVNDVGFRYFFYLIFAAQELEERYLAPIQTVSRAFPTAGERDVSALVGGPTTQTPIFPRDRFLVVLASKSIICLFGVLHAALLALFVYQLRR